MKPWMERLWTNMNAMPGPVWVFGAWCLYRFVPWFTSMLLAPGVLINSGGLLVIGITLLALAGHLLTLWVLWSLIYQKSYALSFAMWYAGLKIAAMFYAVIASVFRLSDFGLAGGAALLTFIVATGVWFAFLYYLERNETIQQLFPRESRRKIPWWAVIPMIVLVGAMNL